MKNKRNRDELNSENWINGCASARKRYAERPMIFESEGGALVCGRKRGGRRLQKGGNSLRGLLTFFIIFSGGDDDRGAGGLNARNRKKQGVI